VDSIKMKSTFTLLLGHCVRSFALKNHM